MSNKDTVDYTLTEKQKKAAEKYDHEQTFFRKPKIDPSFDKFALSARAKYDALEEAKK